MTHADLTAIPHIIAPEVQRAMMEGAPLVALESTIITHGMPWPKNVETARLVEQTVREGGATPATLCVIDGVARIGLEADALDALGQATGVAKLSRADLAAAIATGRTGSTTVAATMILAARAGIEVFATGGIGGVHRGAAADFDISADLQELAQTPVTVVAAGAKAILDLPATLEVLETLGVPVIGYGTDRFPAFWSVDSGLPAPLRMDVASDVAQAHRTRRALGIPGGQLVAAPVPAEAEIPAERLTPLIAKAVAEAQAGGVTGKAVTPFLLSRILELTEGDSLTANIALIRNNARIAAGIATALSEV